MIKAQAPCKDCGARAIGCHGKCERYAAYRKEFDDTYEIRKSKVEEYHYHRDRVCKEIRRRHGR